MEIVCRNRNNCQKEPWFDSYFLQLESLRNKDDHVSLHILYPTIQSYKVLSQEF